MSILDLIIDQIVRLQVFPNFLLPVNYSETMTTNFGSEASDRLRQKKPGFVNALLYLVVMDFC